MTADTKPDAAAAKPAPITFADFLEGVPPSQSRIVMDVCSPRYNKGTTAINAHVLTTPELKLHCASDICNGPRIFRYEKGDQRIEFDETALLTYLTYLCSNCRATRKLFALHVSIKDAADETSGICYKFGEYPNYGPSTPTRLLRLFGKDREIFLKGRQCENHGLGIGAFVYYRRVVESHKDQILDEIIEVAKKVAPDLVSAFEEAKKQHQFLKAVESVKDAIPQALLVNGQNPLTLLHSALSEGLHAQTDEECLEIAHDVRVVLAELAERLGQALKDDAELRSAISRLMKSKDSS